MTSQRKCVVVVDESLDVKFFDAHGPFASAFKVATFNAHESGGVVVAVLVMYSEEVSRMDAEAAALWFVRYCDIEYSQCKTTFQRQTRYSRRRMLA